MFIIVLIALWEVTKLAFFQVGDIVEVTKVINKQDALIRLKIGELAEVIKINDCASVVVHLDKPHEELKDDHTYLLLNVQIKSLD